MKLHYSCCPLRSHLIGWVWETFFQMERGASRRGVQLAFVLHACDIRSKTKEQISSHLEETCMSSSETVCESCYHLYSIHTITRRQKGTSFAFKKTAFLWVEATYLYSPDTLWMLTCGKCVEQSRKDPLDYCFSWPRIVTLFFFSPFLCNFT